MHGWQCHHSSASWAHVSFVQVHASEVRVECELESLHAVAQNLGEAEQVVAVYQYMRLRGYPADKISILTTYNGQRALISDVIESRCARHPAFGRPLKVRTSFRLRPPLGAVLQLPSVLLHLVRFVHMDAMHVRLTPQSRWALSSR